LLRKAATPEGVPQETLVSKMDAAYRQVLRLEALVDQLLDVTRIVSDAAEQRLDDVDLVALVEDVGSRLSELFARAGCELRVTANGKVQGRWDKSRIEQVVSNLLTNGVKYGPGHPIEVTVSVDGRRARVSVKDYGIGIAREQQARIFERFERAVSPRQYGGLGLGLYIARHIVEAHGGLIRVESNPGDGATFTFELPRDPTEADHVPEISPSRHEGRPRRVGVSRAQ
jgi:signal transduction histidine kinase